MVSSLAEQLAKSASLNANLLNEKARKQTQSESYLFAPKEARQHDIESLHAVGANGFLQLKALQPAVAPFEQSLFSDAAKSLDRTLQPAEQNAKLDATISAFLPLLGPFLLDSPTGKVLEWLVRRFRIHEFNVDAVVSLFLPYHETPHFVKMVSILHIQDRSIIRFLQAYKTTAKALHRNMLINEMVKSLEVARFVTSILPAVLSHHSAGMHRALIALHTGVLLEYIAASRTLDENTMAVLLPAVLEPLQTASKAETKAKPALLQEIILGSYLALAAISQKTNLTTEAVASILVAVTDCAARVSPKQLIRTLVSITAPQDQLERVPKSVIEAILAIPHVESELIDAVTWVGAEKLLVPLLNHLFAHLGDSLIEDTVEAFITSQGLPGTLARSAALTLIRELVNGGETPSSMPALRRVLSHLYQRHPKAVEAASSAIIADDKDKADAVEQLVLSLSISVAGSSGANAENATLLVASASADAAVRARSVRDLLARLSADTVPESEKSSISSTLLLRVHDSDASVLKALYTSNPETAVRVLLTPTPTAYLDALVQALHGSSAKPSRDVIRAHFSFLLSHFLPALAAQEEDAQKLRGLTRRIAVDIIFPFLLYTKPRMKTAQTIWGILEAAEDQGLDPAMFELLGGCVEAVRWEQQRPSAGAKHKDGNKNNMDVSLMTKINIAVAAKIADNILASNYFQQQLDSLLVKLNDDDAHARSLVYLVARALLARVGGEQRVNTAHRILRAMHLDTLEGMGDFMRGVDDVASFLNDTSVGSAVVLKPSSHNTLHRLQVALLSVLPSIPRPAGVRLNWVSQHPGETSTESQATRYIQLLRDVYRLSNSSAHLALLSTHLLRSLFVNLGDDALAFLVGVWLAASSAAQHKSADEQSHIQYAALRHAGAFLEAHVVTQRTVDFQTVLPAMLIMLQSQDATVREAAIRCIAVVIRISHAKEAEAVYAFDAIYGNESSKLQYVDWSDFQKYAKAIGETRDNLVHDPEYLQAFHNEHLGYSKADSKKVSGYKQRILCYLLSHVNACPLPNVKVALLRCLDGVSNEAKVQVLLPTIEGLLTEQVEDNVLQSDVYQDLTTYTAAAFDVSAASDINDPDKNTWAVYEQLLTKAFKDARWERPRTALVHHLKHGLFAKLSMERKVQLCNKLLYIAVEDDFTALICKKLMSSILSDTALILRLLAGLQPSVDDALQPASKRARVEKSATAIQIEEISLLAILAEVLGSIKLPGSLELISCLLETLHKITHNVAPDTADRRYVEQLIMSAVENFVQQFPASTIVPAGSLRVDTLVEILRTSENPQSFHQASLLMASLARIAPDAVLHNVMPIFTFMGSNVFHRDDTYSFRVVQKTIDSIVPVMVDSLKGKHGNGMGLYRAAREFLRVFTGAANHIPRHRRVHFFTHLVDTLGPSDFLAPIVMLLVDRVANRVVRQNSTEASGSLFLPLALSEHYQASVQLSLFIEVAREVERLTLSSQSTEKPFLEDAPEDEHPHAETSNKRRALALLMFCDQALQRLLSTALASSEEEREQSKTLLSLLLAVATARPDDPSYVEVASGARSAMRSALGIMSAPDFVTGILTVLQSSSVNAQAGALELFGDRLSEVADKTRRQLTPSIVKIVDRIRAILSAAPESLARPALRALATISDTICPGEEGPITNTLPLVLDAVRKESLRTPALQALLSFSSKLGPRMIPYLKEIVKACVACARKAVVGSTDTAPVATAVLVLRNLLTSISTFWGEPELLQVVELYLDNCDSSESAEMSLLVKTVAKRASPNVLLPALCGLWERSLASQAKERPKRTLSFLQVVKVSVKAASRPAVLETLRELFKAFLSMFELCADARNLEVERSVTTAFIEVVVKLNETAFRPIFRKMFDWAFAQSHSNRRIVFCHLYSALLDFFKALMVPYMTFAWQSLTEAIRGYASASAEDGELWLALIQTLAKSMAADEDRVFWRSDKLRQLVPLAAQQVPIAVRLNVPEGKDALAGCLVSLLGIIDDDVLSKSLNLDILMHSRSEDARVRLLSLTCAERLWRAHGEKLLGFVAETATFIAEAVEDENDLVVREAHKLKAAVESIGGSIDVS